MNFRIVRISQILTRIMSKGLNVKVFEMSLCCRRVIKYRENMSKERANI